MHKLSSIFSAEERSGLKIQTTSNLITAAIIGLVTLIVGGLVFATHFLWANGPALGDLVLYALLLCSVAGLTKLAMFPRQAAMPIGWASESAASELQKPRPHELAVAQESEPDSRELVQFANAWLMPAWDTAVRVAVDIRGQLRTSKGEVIEALFQQAVLEQAVPVVQALRRRLAGQEHPERANLDVLISDAYEKYEFVVKWIAFGGDLVGRPFVDDRNFLDWVAEDEKLALQLRALVALPEFQESALARKAKELADGGTPKNIRERLNRGPHRG